MAKKLSEIEKKASSKALGDLRQHMQGMMNDKMKGVKKVTVASDSEKGLEKGLSMAEEMLKAKSASSLTKSPKGEMFGKSKVEELEEESPEEIEGLEETEEPSEESEEEMEECDTPQKIDAKIDELMKMKAAMLKK